VALTLDILKHGKRFHATVSFDTDTGLKQALATVADYNPLMKDFPINDLLSATELEKIRPAVQQIFSHLRKVRNTKYPIQRCLKLIEAISRDLSQQLLKVLGTRRLMHIPFDEFERVMNQCFEIFSCWDDEYDKLQGLLRDIVKKKRDEHLKMVWRVSADFGDKVEDSSFLNQLQTGVNRWITEIKKVTKLNRDPGSGTALQVRRNRLVVRIHILIILFLLGNLLLAESGARTLSHPGEAGVARSGSYLGHSEAWKAFPCHRFI